MRLRLTAALVVAGVLTFSSCGKDSSTAANDARAACTPAVVALGASSKTWGETLDLYTQAQTHSLPAAKSDKQWEGLNYAVSTLVQTWTEVVAAGGRNTTDGSVPADKKDAALAAESRWATAATRAEDLIRSECADLQGSGSSSR